MKKLMAAAFCAATASFAGATDVLHDDFESYSDTAGFVANWPLTGTTGMELSNAASNSPTNSVFSNGDLARRHYRNFGQELFGSDSNPLLAEFWMNVPTVSSNARQFCEIRGYAGSGYNQGALDELYAIGLWNSAPAVATRYQARVAFGGPSWINLDLPGAPLRTPGWHKFGIEVRGAGVVNFYVDDILSGTITDSSVTSLDSFILGSGLSSNPAAPQSVYIDDVRVVPEPASLGLLALGGLALLRRRA